MTKLHEKIFTLIKEVIQPSGLQDDVKRSQLLRWVTWYWFFVATVLLVVGMRYPYVAGGAEGFTATLFTLMLSVGYWYSLMFLLTVVLFYPLILLLPLRRFVVITSIVFCVVIITLVIIDSFVFSMFRFHLNGMVFSLLLSGAGSEVFVFDTSVYLTALVILILTGMAAILLSHLAWRAVRRQGRNWLGPVIGASLATVFIVENFWFAWADAAADVAITSQARLYPLYTPTRAESFFVDNGLVEAGKRNAHIGFDSSGVASYPQHPLTCSPAGKLPDIFLIAIDSWRYDELNERVTPGIYSFAGNAMQFTHHYSGGNNTRTGIFSLYYGLPATYWENFLDAHVGPVFVNQLLKHKYDMAIYASAKLTSPEFDRTVFSEIPDLRKSTEADSVFGRDVRSTDEFIHHLEGMDIKRPMFGFLFYDAPHSYAHDIEFEGYFKPVAESMNYFELGKNTDPTPYRNLYRNSVRSVDKQVGRVLDAIRASGRWDNAIIIITADHSQEFNDNGMGFWGHNGNFTDAQIRVPLLIKWPGKESRVYDYTTTHYDVTTTLLQEVFKCSNSVKDYSVGSSLFSSENRYGFVVGGFGDFAVRLKDRIYWADKYGGIHVLSSSSRRLGEEVEPKMLAVALEHTSRFYK